MAIRLTATAPGPTARSENPDPHAPPARVRKFGDYELLEEIARGGMGVVYRARQISLNRIVAVKVLLFGQFASDEFVRRFKAEAEAVASLQHPNIVAIHEVGLHEGQHYFSMDYVEGQDLARRARNNPLPAELAADYLRTIAEAIHYAHQRGVLHRDLKPSNVLIDALDQPRITDFGLAKRLNKEHWTQGAGQPASPPADDRPSVSGVQGLTLTGQILGTPNYISPEQASGTRGAVGTYSDIYSLGAILYHLLTGRPPFQADSLEGTLVRLLHTEPIAPRSLNPDVPRDLETVCLKCLEKEPRRRYASAQDLADDLGRWLRREPILARPVAPWEQLLKWGRRKPAIAGLAALLLLSVLLGVSAVLWQWRAAVNAREEANWRALAEGRARERADQALALVEIQRAEELFTAHADSSALHQLATVLRRNLAHQTVVTRVLSNLTQHILVIPLVGPLQHHGRVYFAQFSPDDRRIVTASEDGTAQLWDAETGKSLVPPLRHAGAVWFAQFSPDGQWVATASEDQTARVWDASNGQPLTAPLAHSGSVGWVYFSPDGNRVVTGTWEPDWSVRLWDATTGRPMTPPIPEIHRLRCPPFSPDGRRLLTSWGTNSAMIWDAFTGEPLVGPFKHELHVWAAEFSPDGQRIVTACHDGTVRIWDAKNPHQALHPLPHGKPLWLARFSPNGQRVFTVCNDMTTQIWDAETGRALTGPTDYADEADLEAYSVQMGSYRKERGAEFSSDGQMVVMAFGGRPLLLDANTGRVAAEPFRHALVRSAEFSHDSQRIVTASIDGTVRIWGIRAARRWPEMPATSAVPPAGRPGPPPPVPKWVPGLLDAIAAPESALQLPALRRQLSQSSATDAWTRWGNWLLLTPSNPSTSSRNSRE